jgi:hypothetical protein
VAAIGDKCYLHALARGLPENPRNLFVANVGNVVPVVGGNDGLIFAMLRAGRVFDVVAVAGVIEDADVAGLSVIHQILFERGENGIGGRVLILEHDEVGEAQVTEKRLHQLYVGDSAV